MVLWSASFTPDVLNPYIGCILRKQIVARYERACAEKDEGEAVDDEDDV
jgi:hypothetical protein